MTEEQFIEVKETYLRNIKKYMQEEGGLFSHISIIAEPIDVKNDDDKNAIIHIPIPEEIANSDEGKEYFVAKMIPEIAKTVKKKFDTTGVLWASEAWVRAADRDKKDPLEN